MASFNLPSSPNFFLNWEKEALILYSIRIFSTIFPDDMCTRKSKKSVQYSVFNYCGGRRDGDCHTADWLLSFTWFIPLHCGSGFFSFSFSFGIIVYEKKNFKWQTQTPGALQRLKASQDCWCSCQHPFHWHDGMKGCMSPLPSPSPTSFPCPPPSQQPLPSFIFVKLCELFLNHLSCLCTGFLRRNSTVQWANPFRMCGRQGKENGRGKKSFK